MSLLKWPRIRPRRSAMRQPKLTQNPSSLLAALALLGVISSQQARAAPSDAPTTIAGTWANPAHSLVVRTADCGGQLCGWIVWASDKASADARDAGVDQLIGLQLFRNVRPNGPDRWRGGIYVPDLHHVFGGTIKMASADAIDLRGCVLAGLICRTQTWHRVTTGVPLIKDEQAATPTGRMLRSRS